jgi:hypothetical protein
MICLIRPDQPIPSPANSQITLQIIFLVACSRLQILEKVRSAGKDCILGYGSMERLNEVLCTVEKMIEGPFMRGDFSLADIAAAPFFQVRAERRVVTNHM